MSFVVSERIPSYNFGVMSDSILNTTSSINGLL